jgi:hypothetical protein
MELIVVALAAFYAYKIASSTLTTFKRRRASVDLASFVTACASVDEEASFARSYALVLRNAGSLKDTDISTNDPVLLRAAQDVLTTLDRVATISRYATNEYATNQSVIDERTSTVVIEAHDALKFVISELQQDDPRACVRFDEMFEYCKRRRFLTAPQGNGSRSANAGDWKIGRLFRRSNSC